MGFNSGFKGLKRSLFGLALYRRVHLQKLFIAQPVKKLLASY